MIWQCGKYRFDLAKRPLVMGILNVTPDSFSDGGQFQGMDGALQQAQRLIEVEVDILDIGGESSRPGALPISLDEEWNRVVPVIEKIHQRFDIPISVDTTKAEVARGALAAGACIINDISACTFETEMVSVAKQFRAGVVLMHMQGTPTTMQLAPEYRDVVAEVSHFLHERIECLIQAGISRECLAIDPGIGFGKTLAHNLTLVQSLGAFQSLGCPLCLGVSRKGMIGQITKRALKERLPGSLAVAAFALTQGTAQILRVHDVAATVDVVKMITALRTLPPEPKSLK